MLLIDSMPPATAMSMSPVAIPCAASITAFRPEPQTLLIVIAATCSCRPPLSAAWRAGFWPSPAATTLPMMHSSTDGGIDAGAADGLAHGDGAELRRGELFQRAEELAGRRADRGDDDRLTH